MKPFSKDILDDISLIDIDHCDKIDCPCIEQRVDVKEKHLFCNIPVYAYELLMLSGEPSNHEIPACCQYAEFLKSIVDRIEKETRVGIEERRKENGNKNE